MSKIFLDRKVRNFLSKSCFNEFKNNGYLNNQKRKCKFYQFQNLMNPTAKLYSAKESTSSVAALVVACESAHGYV